MDKIERKITGVVKVTDEAERLKLEPQKGLMAVQRSTHDRHFFDGYQWRLWQPDSKKHFKTTGKPIPKSEQLQTELKKKGNKILIWSAILALILITAITLINIS